jgi:hypothetical protein
MLIDTDVFIWFMRGNLRAARAIERVDEPLLSAVTYMELVQGLRNKRELQMLRSTLRDLNAAVLPITEVISTKAMFYLEQHFHGHALRLADALIGATAVVQATPLLTANVKHYKVIADLSLERFRPEPA